MILFVDYQKYDFICLFLLLFFFFMRVLFVFLNAHSSQNFYHLPYLVSASLVWFTYFINWTLNSMSTIGTAL